MSMCPHRIGLDASVFVYTLCSLCVLLSSLRSVCVCLWCFSFLCCLTEAAAQEEMPPLEGEGEGEDDDVRMEEVD